MTNVYRIGVSLAMSSNSSAVLGVMARELLGIHGQVGHLQQGFSRLKVAIGGALAVGAGVGLLVGLGKLTVAGKELADQQAKMSAAGLSNKEVAEATAKAWNMSGTIMGARVHENLAAIGHLRAAIGDLNEAQRVAPGYMRNAIALGNLTGKDGEGEAFNLANTIHQSGAANNPTTKKLDPDAFLQKLSLYTAMIAASNGKLTTNDLQLFQSQAGSYASTLTDQGRVNLTGAIQSMRGNKVGSRLTALNRALKDGIMQESTLNAFESVGLIDPKKVHSSGASGFGGGAPGGGVTFADGALSNEALFRTDLAKWVWDVLVPKLKTAGITKTADQVNWLQHSKLTAQPTRLLSELIRNQGVDQQEAANVTKASKVDQYKAVMGKSFTANEKGLHDAWLDLMTALGTPLMKPAIAVMQSMTHAIKAVTGWASHNPGKILVIAKTLVIVGAVLIALGVVAVGAAAVGAVMAGGWVALAVAGFAAFDTALVTFVAMNWGGIKSGIGHMLDFFTSIWKWVVDHVPHFALSLPSGGTKLNPVNEGNVHAGFIGGRASAVPPAAAKHPIQVHTAVQLDGRTIAKVVSTHQAKAMSRASQQSSNHFDSTLSMTPVGAF